MESSKLINYSKLLKQTCVDYTQMSVLFLDKLNPNLFGYHVELNKVIAKYNGI